MLLADIRNPQNHTLPAELTETGYPLLIMPRLWTFRNLHRGSEWSLHEALGYLLQVVEVSYRLSTFHQVRFLSLYRAWSTCTVAT